MSKRLAEDQGSRGGSAPETGFNQLMAGFKLEHQDMVDKTLAVAEDYKSASVMLQTSDLADPKAEAVRRARYAFGYMQEPGLIKNWTGPGGRSLIGPGSVFTPVETVFEHKERAKYFKNPANANRTGYRDVHPVKYAGYWKPMVMDNRGRTVGNPTFPGPSQFNNNLPGLLIGARDGKSVYRLIKALGAGSYGAVFVARRVDPVSMDDIPGSEVALKLMEITRESIIGIAGEKKMLEPAKVNGIFAQYILQRSYGGCMPHTVCMYDAFMLGMPDYESASRASSNFTLSAEPEMKIIWYAVICMELMEGSVHDLVSSKEFKALPSKVRYSTIIKLSCKMARAVFDLEMQGIFHDDIKPPNFLVRKIGNGSLPGETDYELKVTDFDLSSMAARVKRPDGADPQSFYTDINSEIIKDATNGGIDRRIAPWDAHGTMSLLTPRIRTTDSYEPPEYDHLRLKYIRNIENTLSADWLSRMMAYELVSTIRELFLTANLSPIYSDYFYPTNVMDRKSKVAIRGSWTLIKMRPDGADNIVPDKPAYSDPDRLKMWEMLRSKTVDPNLVVPKNSSDQDRTILGGLSMLNNMIFRVIAPVVPSMDNHSVEYEMQDVTVSKNIVEPLCATNGDFGKVRPTTGMVLGGLLYTATQSGLVPFKSPSGNIVGRIPTNVQSSLSAELAVKN